MVIAHNLAAMNTQRQFNVSGLSKKRSTEKLSSGYRINRAADDAAGLTISEKMRFQIRGLNQGSENIQDGISLVQVADGALSEITDMLHRMTELSVKAYNGTNTREDREAIQGEIDQLISEVDRVAETATFNELQLLKGNPLVESVKHYISTEPHKESYTMPMPPAAWLTSKSSDKMAVDGGITYLQEMGVMFHTVLGTDGLPINGTGIGTEEDIKKASYYCGPKDISQNPDGIRVINGVKYAHLTDWTPEMKDNAFAKIDFSGLIDSKDDMTLYNNLMQLAGTAFNVPCATCEDSYLGVAFSASTATWSKEPLYAKNGYGNEIQNAWKIDISSMIKKVEELMIKHDQDKEMSADDKKAETKALATELAKSIRDESAKRLMKADSHFDRAFTIGDYAIGIYDYRDNDKLDEDAKEIAINYSAYSRYTFDQYSEWDEHSYSHPGINIACSSNSPYGDNITIDLPNATAGAIGITGYNVARYDETVKTVYSDEYAAKMKEYEEAYEEYEKKHYFWEKTAYYKDAGTEEVKELTYPNMKEITTTKFIHGELKVTVTVDKGEPVYETKTIKKRVLEHEGDEPKPPKMPTPKDGDITEYRTYKYNPDDLEIINRARDYISAQRSNLGAIQNRLEHSYNNNMNKAENTQAAESRIRDTDMGKEMVTFSKHNILEQVGVSMMAQANQSTQGVLSLLA